MRNIPIFIKEMLKNSIFYQVQFLYILMHSSRIVVYCIYTL